MNPIQGANHASRSAMPMHANMKSASSKAMAKGSQMASTGNMAAMNSVAKAKTSAANFQQGRTPAAPVAPGIAQAATMRARAGLSTQTNKSQAAPNPATPVVNPQDLATSMMGDVNGDGNISRADGEALMDFLFEGEKAPSNLQNADFNGDGNINIADAISIMNHSPQAEPMMGDVNGDGTVDTTDGKMLANHIFNGDEIAADKGQADMDGNGSLDISDVIRLLQLSQPS